MSKRIFFFSLAEQVIIANYFSEYSYLSSKKLAEEFGCGTTCIQALNKEKEVILTDWKCHENSVLKKGKSEEFQNVNSVV